MKSRFHVSITVFMLALVLLLFAQVGTLAEESSWAYDPWTASIDAEGELSGDVLLPAEVDGGEVTSLHFSALQDQHGVVSLVMPDTIRALQSYSISYMDGLSSVELSENLQVIDDGNFSTLNALTEITIPASVRCIDSSFNWCENLSVIRFEGECPVFVYPDQCFDMLADDLVIYVPDDQLEAYAAALADCPAADRLQPSGQQAASVLPAVSEEDFEFDAETQTITGYLGYEAFVEIPASIGGVEVRAIGEDAMESDYFIYGVVIPEGVETIGDRAFYQSSNLIYIEFPTSLRVIGEDAFYNAQADSIRWAEGLEEIGARAFMYSFDEVIDLPSSLRVIGESAFEDASCYDLYLGGSIERIEARAFAGSSLCYLVFDLYQPIEIAPDAFADTYYLTDLDLPWDASFETRDAFTALLADQCPDLTVWINNPISAGVAEYPENELDVTAIENGVWTEYHGDAADLTVWSDYDGIEVTALGDGLFKGNQSIRSFYPHHCGWFTTIGSEAFEDSSLEYIELFGSITEIGEAAFRNCVNLRELTIPSSVTYIGQGALDGCTGLEKLVIECDPAILPEDLLKDCTALTAVYASSDASDEQLARLTALSGRPWYSPAVRVGEEFNQLTAMLYEPLPGEDFWYDADFARLDRYNGYELNLILPREIDGTALEMIGGSMMERAAYGDNYEMELPVRSLVIPETYTEIPAYALMNCESLETVICYAPIEFLQDDTFKGCVNLREIVFVNGVHHIGKYVFDGCAALETVYLGAYTGEIDEAAFRNEDGSEAFSAADCLTDPALMPDIDALLAAVRSDPMPTPEPSATPAPAMPIGEEGKPFFGVWNGESMGDGDDLIPLAEFGMTMILTLNEDGTASLYDGEEAGLLTWTVTGGVGELDGMALTITEDGRLRAEQEGMYLYFVPGEETDRPSVPVQPEAPVLSEEGDPAAEPAGGVSGENRLGVKYVCVNAHTEGILLDASMLGAEYSVVFYEDGSMDFTLAGQALPNIRWAEGMGQTDSGEAKAFVADYFGTPMAFVLTEAGFDLNYYDAMLMHFEPEE